MATLTQTPWSSGGSSNALPFGNQDPDQSVCAQPSPLGSAKQQRPEEPIGSFVSTIFRKVLALVRPLTNIHETLSSNPTAARDGRSCGKGNDLTNFNDSNEQSSTDGSILVTRLADGEEKATAERGLRQENRWQMQEDVSPARMFACESATRHSPCGASWSRVLDVGTPRAAELLLRLYLTIGCSPSSTLIPCACSCVMELEDI